jgi:hypothetical protein
MVYVSYPLKLNKKGNFDFSLDKRIKTAIGKGTGGSGAGFGMRDLEFYGVSKTKIRRALRDANLLEYVQVN